MQPLRTFLTFGVFGLAAALVSTTVSAQWHQIGSDLDGEAPEDNLGVSVSFSADGSRMAVGAPKNDGGGVDAGHVRVYEWVGFAWVQLGPDIDGEAADDHFGVSVSLSADGTRVAAGADGNDGAWAGAGHVRVYEWNDPLWVQLGSDIDGEADGDASGKSVSLSADGARVAIGAPTNDGGGYRSGHVRVYRWVAPSWVQLGPDLDGDASEDLFGSSVSLSADGTRLAVGAPFNDAGAFGAGQVRVFEWFSWTSTWLTVGADIYGEAARDGCGYSVSLSADGSRLAVGAPGNDGGGSGAGHVRVFEYVSPNWIQLGADIDGEADGDGSGLPVAISSEGSHVAVGAPYNDGNGFEAGHVRVYNWFPWTSTWISLGGDIDGEADGDWSGYSVALSANGSRVAVGAPFNDGGGSLAGQVRALELVLFADGFESGNTGGWSAAVPEL